MPLQSKEVLTIGSHLILSIVLVLSYVYTAAIGKPDPTLQSLVLIMGGYWYGAMKSAGKTKSSKEDTKDPDVKS